MKVEDLKYLIENFNQPVIFKNVIKWKMLDWTLEDWNNKLKGEKLLCRKNNFLNMKSPIWEKHCEFIDVTMDEFIKYQDDGNTISCLYFDYKYMNEYFDKFPEILQDVTWADFGYPDKTGETSTIWIGSRGAHTPCHIDTYGCNLVAQVYGRKEWIIFPPEVDLKPTRVPYEESSIYSKINFFVPDLNNFKGVSGARAVVLNPGEVLFLPPNWWHYVENLETSISVNIWLPLIRDNRKRVEEALTQVFVSQLTKDFNEDVKRYLLNPNQEEISDFSIDFSLEQLKIALEILKKEESAKKARTTEPNQEDGEEGSLGIDMDKLIKENKDIEVLEVVPEEQFRKLLVEKQSRYSLQNFKLPENQNVKLLEKMINAFCNPETLRIVTDKFLNDNS